jgi:flagellar motility protein MotE (MotC chaperone)
MKSQLEKLHQTPYGRLLAELVELHTQTGGPVEELMNAVEEYLAELETKRKREMEAYEMHREEFLDLI